MKPPVPFNSLHTFLNTFSSNLSVVLLVLATLYFCTGCENKQGVKIGDTPPGISDTDVQGNYVSLSQLKGKVVVLYFWTDTCCGDNLKRLEPFYSQNRFRGLEILAVDTLDSKKAVESYVKDNGITFTMLTDEHAMTSRQYGVIGLPTIFIIDRSGVIREKILGALQTADLEKLASEYLNKPQ